MTKIHDETTSIRKPEKAEEWKHILTKKWQLKTKIKNIDQDICWLIVKKCKGNPLLSLEYFVNLLHNDFIYIDEATGIVEQGEKFERCDQLDDWKDVPIPRLAFKINTALLDKFYYQFA